MRFQTLVAEITRLHEAAEQTAGQSLQRILSVRNWLIGAYIVVFEQEGEDRAGYGARLIDELTEALRVTRCEGLSARNLRNFRQVALAYPELDARRLFPAVDIDPERLQVWSLSKEMLFPQIWQTSAKSPEPCQDSTAQGALLQSQILQTSAELTGEKRKSTAERLPDRIWQTSAKSPKVRISEPSSTPPAGDCEALSWRDQAWLERLFSNLSFSHLLELARIDTPIRRAFYELHCLKERWSVRELQRQRGSLLYERVGLSENREEVLALARQGVVDARPEAQLRDPYVFEFLGLRRSPSLKERDLEQALVDHLQDFLLELGRDFCFVDRQFRITVGNRHRYLDLLFFHRRLRCLVAIDLKLAEFQPEHAGQMQFYLRYLAEEVALADENPPVGILLCADKDAEVVRFATADGDSLFVSRYQLELPSEETLLGWLHSQRAQIEQALDAHQNGNGADDGD